MKAKVKNSNIEGLRCRFSPVTAWTLALISFTLKELVITTLVQILFVVFVQNFFFNKSCMVIQTVFVEMCGVIGIKIPGPSDKSGHSSLPPSDKGLVLRSPTDCKKSFTYFERTSFSFRSGMPRT